MNGTKVPENSTSQSPRDGVYLIQANLDEGHAKINML